MKRIICLTIFSFVTIVSFSQTRRIAHRSHSGTDATYFTAITGNFGLPPTEKEKRKNKPVIKDSASKSTPARDTAMRTRPDSLTVVPSAMHREDAIDQSIQVVLSAAKYFASL